MKIQLLIATLVMFLVVAPIAGQTPSPSPTQQPDEVVSVTTNLVQVDVVVTDKEGKQVTNLLPDDFEIVEDNKRQKITNFSYVAADSGSVSQPGAKTDPSISPARLRPDQAHRTIALVVDDLGLSFDSIISVRQALKKFVDEQMQPNDLIAILRTSTGMGALQQFTSDKRQLYAAIERVRYYPAGRGGLSPFAPFSTRQDVFVDDSVQMINEMEEARAGNIAVGTIGALGYVVDGLRDLPGRKAVVFFSEAFRLFTTQGRNQQLIQALRRLTDKANIASTVIYTIDASSLEPTSITARDSAAGAARYNFNPTDLDQGSGFRSVPPPPARTVERSDTTASIAAAAERDSVSAFRRLEALSKQRDQQNFESQSVLSLLARDTGGLFINNTNDLSIGIRRAAEDQKGYYLIGFRPEQSVIDPATGRRRYRNLKVKVKNSNAQVRARNGFYGISTEEVRSGRRTRDEQLIAALTSPFAAAGVDVRLTTLFDNEPTTGALLRSLINVDANDISFTKEADGSYKTVIDVVAINFGDNGRVVDEMANTKTINVSASAYQRVLQSGLSFALNIPIKQAGSYQLRVAIRDPVSERIGAASQYVEVPDLSKQRLALSGILISGTNQAVAASSSSAAGATASEPDPQAGPAVRRLRQGMILNYAYTIYNAQLNSTGQPQLQTQMRLFRDGKPVFTGKTINYNASKQANMKQLDALGRILVGPDLTPGEYILQIVVTDILVKNSKSRAATATQIIDMEIVN